MAGSTRFFDDYILKLSFNILILNIGVGHIFHRLILHVDGILPL